MRGGRFLCISPSPARFWFVAEVLQGAAPRRSVPPPQHPRRSVAGMAGAGGRGVQDSDLGKGNELMESHLGGKRGV